MLSVGITPSYTYNMLQRLYRNSFYSEEQHKSGETTSRAWIYTVYNSNTPLILWTQNEVFTWIHSWHFLSSIHTTAHRLHVA